MYEALIKELRAKGEAYVADVIEALERNQGCPAWDSKKKICCIMNMPVTEEGDIDNA